MKWISVKTTLLVVIITCSVLGMVMWKNHNDGPSNNHIFIIAPYQYAGTWVFDDPQVGLVKEPFVGGIPEMIDRLVEPIPNAKRGFRMLFSTEPFPEHALKLTWEKADGGGNWYYCKTYDSSGWLCPGLFKYYRDAPKELYVKAEAI